MVVKQKQLSKYIGNELEYVKQVLDSEKPSATSGRGLFRI